MLFKIPLLKKSPRTSTDVLMVSGEDLVNFRDQCELLWKPLTDGKGQDNAFMYLAWLYEEMYITNLFKSFKVKT